MPNRSLSVRYPVLAQAVQTNTSYQSDLSLRRPSFLLVFCSGGPRPMPPLVGMSVWSSSLWSGHHQPMPGLRLVSCNSSSVLPQESTIRAIPCLPSRTPANLLSSYYLLLVRYIWYRLPPASCPATVEMLCRNRRSSSKRCDQGLASRD